MALRASLTSGVVCLAKEVVLVTRVARVFPLLLLLPGVAVCFSALTGTGALGFGAAVQCQ
jgi:hypothetical protein